MCFSIKLHKTNVDQKKNLRDHFRLLFLKSFVSLIVWKGPFLQKWSSSSGNHHELPITIWNNLCTIFHLLGVVLSPSRTSWRNGKEQTIPLWKGNLIIFKITTTWCCVVFLYHYWTEVGLHMYCPLVVALLFLNPYPHPWPNKCNVLTTKYTVNMANCNVFCNTKFSMKIDKTLCSWEYIRTAQFQSRDHKSILKSVLYC